MNIKTHWNHCLGRYGVRCPDDFAGYSTETAAGSRMAGAIHAAAVLFGAWDMFTHEHLYKALVTQLEAIAG